MGGGFELVFNNPEGFVVQYFASNGYTLGDGTMSNLQISMVNFWTSAGVALDGSKFPAFIRVTGYLTGYELRNVQRLAVFFDNVFDLR